MISAILVNLIADISARLSSAAVKEVFSWRSATKNIEELNQTYKILEAALVTAQESSSETKDMAEWLRQVEEAAYELDDLLDETCARISQAKQVLPFKYIIYKVSLAGKIKSALDKLHSIASRKSFLVCGSLVNLVRIPQNKDKNTGESHSSTPEICVTRDDSKREMVEHLIHKEYADDLVVIPIVGMGGFGKTTLAQLLYNSHEISNWFYPLIWVDVSHDFDLKSILKKIVKCLTHEMCDHLEMESLRSRFREEIKGKRYLAVMDNVWSDDCMVWNNLRDLLSFGAKGSRVIITTRNLSVAEAARPGSIYQLRELSEEDSWSLFKLCALRDGHVLTDSHKAIGKEIVAKCCGAPFAIKAVGLSLYCKTTIDDWRVFRDKVYQINTLLPLKQSYIHLPFHLKMCFLYCGIFPKGEVIDEVDLVSLWAANGLIRKPEINEREEDVGLSYVRDLIRMSLLERVKDEMGDAKTARLHVLVHELSIHLSKGRILVDIKGDNVTCNIRHLQLISCNKDWKFPFAMLEAIKNLRTLILNGHLDEMQLSLIVQSCSRLRVLAVGGSDHVISPVIGQLLHLRYLKLCFPNVSMLPESITELRYLQVLKLDDCTSLQKLSEGMMKMGNLEKLSLSKERLTQMPKGIGKLIKLCKLYAFTVSDDKKTSATLEELRGLYNLRGALSIVKLEHVREFECKEAVLREITGLDELHLNWGTGSSTDMRTMNALKPHDDLKRIKVDGYGGALFPDWLFRLYALSQISIIQCRNLSNLSHLYRLRSLKKLSVSRLNMEFIETCEFTTKYKNLEVIEISECETLKGWCKGGCRSQFPVISELRIEKCPEFAFFPDASVRIFNSGGCPKFTFGQRP